MTVLDPGIAGRLKRSADGLMPAVVQQHDTGEVLMLGWMDDEALARTMTTGRATYWSRSRREYWVKGETSGHRQWVKEVRLDCDGDTLLVKVDQEGPACHTGERTCFYRTLGEPRVAVHEALASLSRTLASRQAEMPDGSYSAELFRAGPDAIGAKVEEEAEETARAAREESDERLRAEAADLVYHLGVLLQARGMSFADALEELTNRMPVAR